MFLFESFDSSREPPNVDTWYVFLDNGIHEHKYSKKSIGDNLSVNVLTLLPKSVIEYMMKGTCTNTVLRLV